jgi:PTS system mannose-specific IIB component
MRNIVLTRIDDRLIHGQIMTEWTRSYHPTEILVIDDETYADEYLRDIVIMAVPKDVKANVLDTEQATSYLLQNGSQNEKVLILVKIPQTVEKLVEGGLQIEKVNLGGMAKKADRTTLYRNISTSSDENASMKRLAEKGIKVFVQVVPRDKEMPLEKLI